MKTKQQTRAISQARAIKQSVITDFDPNSFVSNDERALDDKEYLTEFCYAMLVMSEEEAYFNVN